MVNIDLHNKPAWFKDINPEGIREIGRQRLLTRSFQEESPHWIQVTKY